MSDSVRTIVELSLSAPEARVRRDEVAAWLLDTGVIAPNARRRHPGDPGEYMWGPAAHLALADPDERICGADIDITARRDGHVSGEFYEGGPPCPACHERMDADRHGQLVHDWSHGPEPTADCAACGHRALLGDWPDEYGMYVAELAVSFVGADELSAAFVEALGRRMGPRHRLLLARW